ncbi:hypothetical protein GUITHDRAFT_145980 [Guillardia theta CCMP2712]|uniref:Uncharacterized protein n=1 Tax=Guillardia theta (strain CCMP2712) TaxID=905079 RepID=L1IK32_GUITC|nr:hypothetical protein GUITHDRAFT_145980 [Guillardia theta CCMP2712]EKX36165.1 hypothetical protein GUITHDRAFT_145980 [Guillardia theta CCMP2712]|eukprot:XP_005823145.1 hypothetical protein GUITHDRAFT_145980 [Guillardia theta CCMP2712]
MSLSKFQEQSNYAVAFHLCRNMADVRKDMKKIQGFNYQAPYEFMNYHLKYAIPSDKYKCAMQYGNYLMLKSAELLMGLKDKFQKPLDGNRKVGIDEKHNFIFSDPCTVIQAMKLHNGHYYENFSLPKDLMEDLENPSLEPPFLVVHNYEVHWFPASKITPGKNGMGWYVDSVVRTVDDQMRPVQFFAAYSSEERNEYSRVLYDNCEFGPSNCNIDIPFKKFEYSQESLDAMKQFPHPPMLNANELPDSPLEASSEEEWKPPAKVSRTSARK